MQKKLRLLKQERSFSCSVACLRMILDYYGIETSEEILRIKSKTKFYGTHPINLVECARFYGFTADIRFLNLDQLQAFLEQQIPIIANILKFDADEFYLHSVVVYQMRQNKVYILDPEDGHVHLERSLFEQLWQKNEFLAIVIQKC
jgi:ATP-binding cassette subfamily B protein